MIIRINQIDPATAETSAGWSFRDRRASIGYGWEPGTFVYQVFLLDHDERGQTLPTNFVHAQMRRLIPQVVAALAGADDHFVLRLDGPLTEDELLPAYGYLAEHSGCRGFSISAAERLSGGPAETVSSIRLAPSSELLASLCDDVRLGLQRSVRLRGFGVSEENINAALDAEGLEDPRWEEILREATFTLSTAQHLSSLLIWTNKYPPEAAKNRIMQKLVGPG